MKITLTTCFTVVTCLICSLLLWAATSRANFTEPQAGDVFYVQQCGAYTSCVIRDVGNTGKSGTINPLKVARIVGYLIMIITGFIGLVQYNVADIERKNLWSVMLCCIKNKGKNHLEKIWFCYCLSIFGLIAISLVVFPLTIVLPILLGTWEQVVIYVGAANFVMFFGYFLIATMIGYFRMLIETLKIFKPIK